MHQLSIEEVQSSPVGMGSNAIRSIDTPRFIAPLGCAAVWPIVAGAQHAPRTGRRRRAAKKMALALAAAVIILITTAVTTALAAPKSNRIRVKYVLPKEPTHQQIYERLKEHRSLERLQHFLSPFRLPRTLTISLKGCDGEADAWYDKDEITLCYEYVEELWKHRLPETAPGGLTPFDTVLGPLCDTALHEFAHALFDMLKVPVLGREEDAADQVAVYINLHFGKADARRLILGTAYAYGSEAERAAPLTLKQFSDEHGTPAQRAYNELCIAYGADPKMFGDLVTRGYLPEKRAEACGDEYQQIASAYEKLIMPHLNRALSKRILDRAWLPKSFTNLH